MNANPPKQQAATRSPPSFPAAFEAEYTFALPYVQVVQSLGLSFPVHVWYDGNKGRMRLDVYDGLDSLVQTDDDTIYTVYPRLNRTACDAERGEVGPTADGGSGAAALGKLLNDAVRSLGRFCCWRMRCVPSCKLLTPPQTPLKTKN